MEIEPDVDWQVLTNSYIYNVPLSQLFAQCWRYQTLYNALQTQSGVIYDWQNGLEILQLPTWGTLANGTQWSDLFDLNEREIYLSLYRDFDNIVRVDIENFEFLNFGNFYLDDIYLQEVNGNGIIEPGEWVYMITDISADFLSTGVSGILSCDDPDIEITAGSCQFGDLQPGEPGANTSQPFSFNVSENITSQQIEMILTLTTDYGYEFELNIPLDIAGVSVEYETIEPEKLILQNYPNPFNPSTTISFDINTEITENTEIAIFNLKGQELRTFSNQQITQSPNHQIIWDGTDQNNQPVASGIYYYKLTIGNKLKAVGRCLLLK
jgi:hypothetical protein